MTARVRTAAFGAVVVLVAGGSTAYALGELHRTHARDHRAPAVPTAASLTAIESGPRIVFRHTGLDKEYGVVAEVPLADPSGPRAFTGVSCDRVDARPTGATCLQTKRGVVTRYDAVDLDTQWRTEDTVPVAGIPSRTRLSPDGTLAASTVFVNGDSYVSTGFSTRTVIRRTEEPAGDDDAVDLESFALILDGRHVAPADRNLWGVTFAPDDRTFYATAATGGHTYLVRGDLPSRTLTEVATHVECPSLSPDGTRIAFKQAVSARGRGSRWTPAVLDLATGRRTVLSGETRNVDDQIAWLDDDTLLYGLPHAGEAGVTDVWALDAPADDAAGTATARPRLLVPEAWSPAVVR